VRLEGLAEPGHMPRASSTSRLLCPYGPDLRSPGSDRAALGTAHHSL
jgi:hypothetical protein